MPIWQQRKSDSENDQRAIYTLNRCPCITLG
jgi:hypothetical protein